jgi:hypothetical protein
MRNNRDDLWFHCIIANSTRDYRACAVQAHITIARRPPASCKGTTLRSGPDSPKKPQGKRGTAKVHSKDKDMGSALRSVYQKTVEEAVPSEMLDLLGKLD